MRENRGNFIELNQCFLFATLIKRSVIAKIGYLDESFGMGCFEDADYAIRAAMAGYRCAMLYSAYVEHTHGVSFKALGNRDAIVARNEQEFLKKWPRHLRIGVSITLGPGASDNDKASGLLRQALFLAREWCWVNILVSGRRKVSSVHQNIRFGYCLPFLKNVCILMKLLERSFGTKKLKRYDLFLVDDKSTLDFLKMFYGIHRTKIILIDFNADPLQPVRKLLQELRGFLIYRPTR